MRFGPDPIPGSIVKAQCYVMSKVGAIAKNGYNKHGGYKHSTADDVYAAVIRLMAEAGLVLLTSERLCEIKRFEITDKDGAPKTVQWAHFEFGFTWATEDATWTDEGAKRTLYLQVTGPQTFQAAQSFAEKSYLRSTLKLATGDIDLDSYAQADTEEGMVKLAAPRKPKSSAAAKRDGTDKTFNEIIEAINGALDPEMLKHLREETYAEDWKTLPERWHQMVEDAYELKMDSFKAVLV